MDTTDVERGIVAVEEQIPIGDESSIELMLAKWLPAYHAPRGPIDLMAGLTILAAGARCAWIRDPADPYRFRVEVPSGAQELRIRFQALTPTDGSQGPVAISEEILWLDWESACLYPAGSNADEIRIHASLRLPDQWEWATSLDTKSLTDRVIEFEEVDLRTLIDSPVLAGRHAHVERLDADIRLTIVADRPDQLPAHRGVLQHHRNLVAEADALFGRRPFERYDFLMSVSDHIHRRGLEHRASSENGVRATYFSDWEHSTTEHDLLPHEYSHSWIGKYRVPSGNLSRDFASMTNELMWVYEGLTQFYGHVLAARSGLISRAHTREAFALIFATYDSRPGRQWRPLVDTEMDPIFTAREPQPWRSWQRSEDYYSEGLLIWLEADMLIRAGSAGQISLDDFSRRFFAPPADSTARPAPAPYTRSDLISALDSVFSMDWSTFFTERIDDIARRAPYRGIELGGYRLAWRKDPSDWLAHDQHHHDYFDFTYSLGMVVGADARVTDVLWDGPAFSAGLTRGATIVAVGGHTYSHKVLRNAIDDAQSSGTPVSLIIKRFDAVKTVVLPYTDGQRYPTLDVAQDGDRHLDALLMPLVDRERGRQ